MAQERDLALAKEQRKKDEEDGTIEITKWERFRLKICKKKHEKAKEIIKIENEDGEIEEREADISDGPNKAL